MLLKNTIFYGLALVTTLVSALGLYSTPLVAQNMRSLSDGKTQSSPESSPPNSVMQKLRGEWVQTAGCGAVFSRNTFFSDRFIFGENNQLSLIDISGTPQVLGNVEDTLVELQYLLKSVGDKLNLSVYSSGSETDRLSLDIQFCADNELMLTSHTIGKLMGGFSEGEPTIISLRKVSILDKMPPLRRTRIIDRMDERTGRGNLGVINRAQQAYQLENGRFADKVTDLDARLKDQHYQFEIRVASVTRSITVAIPRRPSLKPIISGVAITGQEYHQLICQSKQAGVSLANPIFERNRWRCGAGSIPIE